MNDRQEQESPAVQRFWSQVMVDVLAWQVKILETQCQVGLKIVEAPLRMRGSVEAGRDKPRSVAAPAADAFQSLESRAIERARAGFALPREIYSVPYRDRVNWSRFPDWARPIDPELFQESGHEG